MVAVTHSISQSTSASSPQELLCEGLQPGDAVRVAEALAWAHSLYGARTLGTGEPVWEHALGTALIAASLRLDADTRIAALCFAVGDVLDHPGDRIAEHFGAGVAGLVDGLRRLNGLRVLTRLTALASAPEIRAQTEVLRKMLLAMVEDIRVVLLRVASRTQTLRYFTDHPGPTRDAMARESLDIYAPLANRLGIWQLKWELEDLSFRFLEPDTYKRIAKMLDERRVEREQFIVDAVERVKREVAAIGVEAEVYGRPKHIYSIYNKMRSKRLDFSQIYDVRALRVLVHEVKDCYAVLGIVHQMWTPIPKEFDDYISMPKGNNYQSLHTAVYAGDGRSLEVQIRTHDMHHHAELGVAAHWRYKEGSGAAAGAYDEKIALLRSLLSWRDEVTDAADWLEQFKRASLDDTIYVLTPQGRVIDLQRGATPIDFAYRVHTDLGHRCRGAKVNGQLVTLNTPLESGQTVEIMSAKEGGPSRDWLNPHQAYVATPRARQKIKQFFSAQEEEELLVRGRSVLTREMQREGFAQTNIDELATRLGFKTAEAMFIAAGRGELGPRAIQTALRGADADDTAPEPEVLIGRQHSANAGDTILIVGVGKLMTSLGRCCKPAPPDAIQGYVTRGRGVSIHRIECRDFQELARAHPERLVAAQWGSAAAPKDTAVFPVDILVHARDRQGLLRDISEVLSREKLNVIAVNTLSRKGAARMRFTIEVQGVQQIQRAISLIHEIKDVTDVERG
ncbi:MAG TPA: bifunctional (p)ppGpp synthetase/guanosine-3',5'-bis(diphosphate) 3'-pyrophosphohydrolase [Zoogloea sp.]|uniref:RelA/SpoT family protein n=1 Tax=Zoogloea sp. TaxID=49181 RepID=UPI002CD85C29|nr:bifunctional (p)ppGpp synthetase/guanosine-3',5'-bis(diphosphate) 3'-pyrophosphohydrolase [Zoogloea sp.]HMW52106.1 bifunctional (p)ppGpp synthetase/guanosine-3',5'-bis(diphosphate) 3'-pyrophosphohydrolase [Rhodocyclaceae bacterium]HNA69256.1 bifunctional (p)ppGpp synthetase/guanosine-3',5'-bis(diphosphate) 3'-pyrophosphohydrolase [Rhodocyclaceae bacterium]HNB66149.1 bifunctional (p)ppGpp synthetase/guanosine-3',5'-bis(diphosphate) 3'-pyrophosphohydrolase [Rhodocyclaceae bacterium]HNC78393.1 